jgi:hypothetical protein
MTLPAAAQETVTATSGDPAIIAQIRQRFATIQRDSASYRRTTRNLQGFSLEGGELEAFFQGTQLRKLKAQFYGEMWRGSEEYYFWDDRLFFVFAVLERYDRPLSGRVRVTVEHRHYFHDDRLIRRVVTQRPRDEEEGLLTEGESAAEILSMVKRLRACAGAQSSEPPECVAPER